MIHIAGVKNKVADGLSRHPSDPARLTELPDDTTTPQLKCAQVQSYEQTSDVEVCTIATTICTFNAAPITAVTWDLVRTATSNDTNLNTLLELIETGFLENKPAIPQELQIYQSLQDRLTTVQGVIMYNDRILVPKSLQQNVLHTLHSAHQGISKMTARAESMVYWPGITSDIREIRENCNQCNRNTPSQPRNPPTSPIPVEYPFQCVCTDYFTHKGISYLVIVDRYSNWPLIEKSTDGAAGLVSTLKQVFHTFGIPEELASDGGPEYTAATT